MTQSVYSTPRQSFSQPLHSNTPEASPRSSSESIDSFHSALQTHQTHDGAIYNSEQEAAIHNHLFNWLEKHITDDNREEMQTLLHSRTTALHEMGETPASIEATIAKGQTLDRLAQIARGAVRSIPFAVASVAFDKVPQLSAFAHNAATLGLTAGLQSGIADTFGCSLLDRATANTRWLHGEADDLEPVMQQAQQKTVPSPSVSSAELGVAYQAYSVRNLARLATAATVTHFAGPAAAGNVDTWLTGAGGIASGAVVGGIMQDLEGKKGRTGPEFLLGRKDWQQQYQALKAANVVTTPLAGLAKRSAGLPLDLMTDGLSAARSLLTLGSAGKTTLLAGGFSGILSLRACVSEALNSKGDNAASAAALSHTMNVLGSAALFAMLPGLEILAEPAAKKASSVLQEDVPAAVQSAADWFGRQAQQRLGRQADDSTLNAAERQV